MRYGGSGNGSGSDPHHLETATAAERYRASGPCREHAWRGCLQAWRRAYRANGTTIEVHNTDAEGRLVLADVLSVAVDNKAARIIDLATLTGPCVVALGLDVAGLMTNDQAWCDEIKSAADAAGEQVWQLPMFPEYGKQILGSVADIKNVGEGRWGGAMTAAKLLERFVDATPWTHIDIAGPAFLEKPKPWLEVGASGR